MLTFFDAQYWEWMTFFPQILRDTLSTAASTTGFSEQPDGVTSPLAQVVARKPLRRTLSYNRSRKHL